jgi:hypothetical protein
MKAPDATLQELILFSSGAQASRTGLVIGQAEDCVGHPPLERLVVHELFEELRVVLKHGRHDAHERFIVLDAGVLFIRVLSCVLVGRIDCHAGRDVLRNELVHPVGVRPGDIAELVIEGLENVGKPIQLRFREGHPARRLCRFDIRILIRKLDLDGCLLFHPVTVHVDGFEDSLREIFLHRGR